MRKCKRKIREKYVYEIISQFQEDQGLSVFPLDPKKIIEKNGWKLIPYTNSHDELMAISHDGFTYYYDGVFYIYYNESKPPKRIRFTLFHEIGHIILNHHIEFKKEILQSSEDTSFLESEANIVARNLMAPAHLICNLYHDSYVLFSKFFQMSDEALTNRMKWLNRDFLKIKYKDKNFLFSEIKRLNQMYEQYLIEIDFLNQYNDYRYYENYV